MSLELPEGISFSRPVEELEEELVPFQDHNVWQCDVCELSFESFLLTPNGRYEGLIRNSRTGAELWSNKLPRDVNKALKLLQENLDRRVENHRKAH